MTKRELFLRTFKDVWHYGQEGFFYKALISTFSSAIPFLNFIYIAQILTHLAAKDFDHVYQLIIQYLILFLILNTLVHCLKPIVDKKHQAVLRKMTALPNEKLLVMNFHYADEATIKEKIHQINRDQLQNNSSFKVIYHNTYLLIEALIQIAFALILLAPLWQAESFYPLNWLHPYILNSILIIIIFVVIILQTILSQKTMQGMDKLSGWLIKINNTFNYLALNLGEVEAGKEIRLYHLQGKIKQHINQFMNQFDTFEKVYFGGFGKVRLVNSIGSQLITGSIYLLIGARVILGNLPVGSVVQMIGGINQLMTSLVKAMAFLNIFAQTAPMERFYELMDLPDEEAKGSIPIEKRLDNNYQLSVKNLSFTFPGAKEATLHNISEDFEVGKHYAIVGENGSGKTTFIKVMMRLYEPSQGKVMLNKIDADKYSLKEFYQLFSVVFQDFRLLGLSMAENIAVQPNYDPHQINEALDELGLKNFVDSLDKGIKSYLGTEYDPEGVNVSGGQAQKIAMARAIYKDAPVFILDEPTAALDPVAEFEIYQKFAQIVKNKTAFYISHRLSSCRFCDEILVFDQGRIVQRGSHESLVKQEGKYKDLWQAQAQYYQ
ncbi:ABC transporter ATP-binding protein [Facklamia miroungae]|uniref:ATP-binding cassette, subfamily B n=1 Tax=Facklamia miroungae TaxID=120956 RepID=A0A1G7UVW0_9LACT|nr:ABC transporter ATP-binding protein [Facklamia miroungae]NKZ30146.1 ABC transporter ATP-binding protein [Facklamia miroungae]SDG51735.1 ATP-binding cassette, subfamily B [Facklamia miroungae]